MSRTDKDYEAQKEKLIHIALEVFIEQGYEHVTMTQLRKAFKLSVGGMYHYFSSKEEILDVVIQYGIQTLIEEAKARIATIPIEEKLLNLFSDSSLSAFVTKLYQYTDDNKNSLVAYKLREQSVNLAIPVVSEIFQQGIEAGIYKSDFPEEMAEFFMLLTKAITETNFLPKADKSKRKKRIEAFLYMFKVAINPPVNQIDQMRSAFDYTQ